MADLDLQENGDLLVMVEREDLQADLDPLAHLDPEVDLENRDHRDRLDLEESVDQQDHLVDPVELDHLADQVNK